MAKKTLLKQAREAVPEFKTISDRFLRKYTIAGKSESCTNNYLMQISKMVLHCQSSPLSIPVDQVEDYMFTIQQNESPGMSSFKHLVYGLRTMYAMFNNEELYLSLPPISRRGTLPVVLSINEVKLILKTPKLLGHKVLLAVIYDCGLRVSEVVNLKLNDVDFDRKMVHIRQSKHKKDRLVPVSPLTIRGLQAYIRTTGPKERLFNGKARGAQISREGIRHAFRAIIRKANIEKEVCIRTLRHSHATHLLEMGPDIVSMKNQLGHAETRTAMMCPHIAEPNPIAGFGPMEWNISAVTHTGWPYPMHG